jgi:scyllo-inositol 2-dehydrogenase (NADP+)
MTRSLRALLVGYGFAGGWIHDPLIRATPGIDVGGIVTNDPSRRSLAQQRHGAVACFDDLDSALASEFDVVVLAVPNDLHLEFATQALHRARVVVVDKPVAPNADAARRLAAAADGSDAELAVFHNRRWDGDFLTVIDLVRRGDLGAVHRFESRFDRWTPDSPRNWRDGPALAGGGVLLDLGSHLVDQAIVLLGPVRSVYAELGRTDARRESDDRFFISLEHANGVVSHLFGDAQEGSPALRYHVSGSHGAYVKYGKDIQEERLLAGEMPVPGRSGVEPPDRWGEIRQGDATQPVTTRPGDWTQFYAGLVAHLRGESALPVTVDEAVAVATVLDAARESAHERTTVTVGEAVAGAAR